MESLNYALLEEKKNNKYFLKTAPERVLQFGEGNFLRAFADCFIDIMNEKADFNTKVVICQPLPNGLSEIINRQDGLYTLQLKGIRDNAAVSENRIISCISRCINPYSDFDALLDCAKNPDLRFIISNTTEAGIVYDDSCCFDDRPQTSFPGKLTRFLYERYRSFKNQPGKGFIILSCELIDNNGEQLKSCVLSYARQWQLDEAFIQWLHIENIFCSTLVDRIVPGYPKDEAPQLWQQYGYRDDLLDVGELFGLWVIEGPDKLKDELPFEASKLPIIITNDHQPYKQRKVRILNGVHTAICCGAYLSGARTVLECMENNDIRSFIEKLIYHEVIPCLDLPENELLSFAADVLNRFKNPLIRHELLSITLNTTSKLKSRILPSIKAFYNSKGTLPKCLTAAFAFYIALYRQFCIQNNGSRIIQDTPAIIDFFKSHRYMPSDILCRRLFTMTHIWGEDLSLIPGFENTIVNFLNILETKSVQAVIHLCTTAPSEI